MKKRVKEWCEEELETCQDVSPEDLLYELILEAEDFVFEAGKEQEQQEAGKESLSEDKRKQLEAAIHFLTFSKTKTGKCYHKEKMLQFCEVVDRKANLVHPMTFEESKLVCMLSWQSFDRIMHVLSYGSDEDLAGFFPEDPEEYRKKFPDMAIAATDAVPVYLDSSTGMVLVPIAVLHTAQERRVAKKQGVEPEALPDQFHITAEGESSQDKNRLTWLVRLALFSGFKKDSPEKPAPRIHFPLF